MRLPGVRRKALLSFAAGLLVAPLLGLVPPGMGPLAVSMASAAGPCGPPVVNVIACENTSTGDPQSDWLVAGAGDQTLQGYATSMSVNVGQTVSFKISSTQSRYHFDILRIGYYQGTGARKLVSGMAPTAAFPQTQPACLTNSATGLIDCGNWSVSASWAVPANAVSGVYLAHIYRDDTGGGADIPFVVRNDASHSDVVFQTSDETWQAYNTYGGNSLYQCTVACPPGSPAAYKAAYKVSYNRPFHTPGDDQGRSWLTYAELPMIKFLEANGYDTSYIAGTDVDTSGALLLNHKLFMSTGHDEYWTGNQRANVVAARDQGVNLAFFSGNELFWKTRFEPSTDGTNTPQRTLTSYKDTHFDTPQDPQYPSSWTGTWEDPRFSPPGDGGNPANALTGQKFVVNSGTTDIKVPSTYSQLRLWRNTPVASLASGQSATLGAGLGTLGYEWDEDTDNGFRPAGLFDLSSTTSTNAEVFTDYGSTTKVGSTATHSLTLYKAPSGALVFGAGTVQWAWGLDNTWTLGATDRTMQQATVNLLADMGAQPYALIAGLVTASPSLDTTRPTSQITSPAPAANLTDGSAVTIQGTAGDTGGGVVAGVEVSTDGGTTWHPATGKSTWTYAWTAHGSPSVTLRSRAVDDSGNLESPSAGPAVNVACPCSVFGTSVAPAVPDGADPNSTEIGVKFTSDRFGTIGGLRFYKSAANTGTHIGNLWTVGGQLLATATFAGETASGWQQVSFSSPVPISPNTTYVASYFAPKGHYANDNNYLHRLPQSPNLGLPIHDSPPLHLLLQTPGNPNGVYNYGSSSGFPQSADLGVNFWVDVIFTPQPAPGTPSNVVATPGYTSAGLTWSAPSTGGSVTTYTVTPFIGSAPQTPTVITGNPAATAGTVTGLTNGTAYTFTVGASNPNGAGGTSAPSNAVTPSASASVVIDPGFENGMGPWTPAGTPSPVVTNTKAHSGTSSAFIGALDPAPDASGDANLSQLVTVPTGTTQLSFWYWAQSSDTVCSVTCIDDWNEAQIRNAQGNTLAQIFKSNTNARVWAQVVFDTTAYAGQSIVLWFNVHGDGSPTSDNTAMYLDDVSLTTTGPPASPGAPTGITATSGSGSATISWIAPNNGGSPITAYVVTPFVGTTAQIPVQVTGSPPATTTVLTGLTPNTAYTFKVSATNAVGTGPSSAASNSVIIGADTVPATPTNVSASAGNTTATVSWTAPFNGGSPITSYTVTGRPQQGETGGGQVTAIVTGSPPATSTTVTGLPNGTAYAFSIIATNSIGPSQESASSNSVIPGALPAPPTDVVGTGGNASATISWTAPADGGSPITSYLLTPYVGAAAQVPTTITGSPPSTTATLALNNGTTYTFTVSAANAVGAGPASAPSNPVTPSATVPGAPTGVTGSGADASATVSWTAPANGGSPVTSYVITPFIGTTAQATITVTGAPPATSTIVGGLTNGTTYTFTVSAANAIGAGPASAASAPVTPAGVPGAPGGVSAAPGNASASVSWTAPANGGSNITGYTVTPFVGANGQGPTTVSGSALSAAISGLANGTTYTFKVAATNAVGQGPQSSASNPVTPTGALAACPCTIFAASTPAIADSGDASSVVLGVAFSSDTTGFITGIRFFKAAGNTGTHVGTLWSATGTALATANFSNETASGWQQVSFANPVAVTAGATYVASYLAPVGHYSVTANTFAASGVDNPPLHALPSATTPDGRYIYGANAFPTNSFSSSNYWVDVVFNTNAPPGAPTAVTAASGDTTATVSWTAPTNSGSSSITTYTVTPYVGTTAQAGTVVAGSPPAVSTTVAGLANGTSYTFQVSATSAVGTGPPSAPSNAVTPHPPPPPCPCTILGSSTSPATADSGDAGSVVLGVSFNAETDGFVTGLRFYKSAANTGSHVGALWSASGQLLATATFTGETGSGWQQVNLSSPVAVTAGTTYVASYLAPAGHYAVNGGAFASAGIDSPPLHALSNTTTPNGRYIYSSTNAFPTNTFNATNYWVDVVFNQTVQATAPGTPIGVTATPGNASATVSWGAAASGGSPITSYTVTPFIGTTAQTSTVVSGSPPATSVLVSGLTNGTSYTFTVTATNAIGTGPSSSPSTAVTPVVAPTCPCTIFGPTVPATSDSGDGGSVVLGVAFTADATGFVSGIRFYKSSANTGTHVGDLWSASGQLLGSATFAGETASGWQVASFSNAIAITAGTTYVASYLAPAGHYSVNGAAFASAGIDSPPLHALSNTATPNGRYVYGSASAFPTSTFNASNYWVDVVYRSGTTTVPGSPGGVTASPGYPASATVSWTAPGNGGSAITGYTITPFIGTNAQAATSVAGSAVSATVTGLANDSTYTFQVTATNAIGIGPTSAPSNPVTPHAIAPACPCTIFGPTTPAGVDSGDNGSVVLGVAFTTDTAGYITGVRFYKSAANTGTHVGALWSAGGVLLSSATFTGETGSGWQQVSFPTPIAVAVGTTYVATYLAPAGHYSFAGGAFTAQVDKVPLHALASSAVPNGNGLYSYSASNVFPTNGFNATNYWVDPVFGTATLPAAPTGVAATAHASSAAVSWTAPANGGSAITQYTVTPFIGTTAQTPTTVTGSPPATSTTVTGLSAGTAYTFKVSASNAVGTGPQSAASNSVTPCAFSC